MTFTLHPQSNRVNGNFSLSPCGRGWREASGEGSSRVCGAKDASLLKVSDHRPKILWHQRFFWRADARRPLTPALSRKGRGGSKTLT